MEIVCEQCKTKLNVPDEKIPREQVVKISCPKCKNRITIDTRSATEEKPSSAEPQEHDETGRFHLKFLETKSAAEGKKENEYGYADYSGDESLDSFEKDARLALVMTANTDQMEKIKSALNELNYKFAHTSNTRDAMGKLRFQHFDLVLLCAGFDGQDLEQSAITNYLNRIAMPVRRKIFLALIGDMFKSADNMMAFAMSANVVINTKDMDKLGMILKKAIVEHEKFYKIFMDTLVETGKV